ncbi:MAG: aminotransferase class I/II-fold pyridoxal phosphate-dependent enzyme, partial [Chloroflexota bacterium]
MDTMLVNLNEEINRRGTGSVKYRAIKRDGEYMMVDLANPDLGKDRVLQMWVADMDFRCCSSITEALKARIDHGIFGYTSPEDSYYDAVISWAGSRYGWEIEREWISTSPGVVPALYMLVPELTEPDEKVLIQRPVYFPFTSSIENSGREVVSNSLIYNRETNRYEIDFDDLAEKAADPKVTLAILCSPHNPVGRVWTRSELSRMADIFLANGVKIISDEIHCDLIFDEHTFVPMASISEEVADQTITCMAPSKT